MTYVINSDRNAPWNALPELPIDKRLYEDLEVYGQLGNAKAALGRLQGRSIAIPNQALLINSISLQEAKASSVIENIFTIDDELYKAFKYLQTHDKIDVDYFVKTYRVVSRFNDGIRTPVAQIVIKEGGTGPNAGKVFYTPPRGKGVVEAKMDNLAEFLNDDGKYTLDPLLKMAIGHYQFEAIYPFRDGNGRPGRIFNINYLAQRGLLDYPILFLSKFIVDHKDEYYAGLAGITKRGSWKTWLMYILKAVEVTSNITYDKINDIIAAKEAILDAIVNDTDIERPELLVNAIFTLPFTRVKHLVNNQS